ncbi:peptidase M16 [Aliidiomarina iranensis]|uniref:Protease 3 n=1 Tax=Aliidiomarina iranensis TaxID=1434071 RepID=A0A432VX80_9GAMM|nr:insulinase family protein [Aliidiomarina iranensis]RUO21165.1 peptidase M16 [Aliidiomarina iranensis]
MKSSNAHLTPESSAADNNRYRYITLDNGLRVLLVHSPTSPQSAASFAVNAGHFQDPDSAPGVAHFLEHLLFLGTQSFPDADAFAKRIDTHGGHFNAWTGTEHSNYYFTTANAGFAESLMHFAELFKAPLLAEEWVEKERQSIEAEYRLKLKDELRRLYEVHKTLANPEHPFSKFSVGNAITLADSASIKIRERLMAFHQQYYVANNAALVLAGPDSLNQLAELAAKSFGDLVTGDAQPPLPDVPIYQKSQKGCFIRVKPIKQAARLILTFPLPEINSDYLNKTTSFIAHLLGYEGPGSLCYFLRQKQWINELSAGGGMSGYNFKDFNINMQLTEEGLQQVESIMRACYQYIQLIGAKGLQKQLYNERQQMISLAYQFPESIRVIDMASQLAINMLHYEPEHVVSGDYRMDALKANRAHELLLLMCPENTRATLIYNAAKTNKKTKFYGAEYSVEAFSKKQIAQFKMPFNTDESAEFTVPTKNPYIPERIKPHEVSEERQGGCERSGYSPKKLRDENGVALWHLQDIHFREPQAHIYLSLQLPLANASARNNAISRIWCELGQELLSEQFYDAEVAGMHFNLYPQQAGITLHLAGFSDRQPTLFKDLMRSLAALRSSEQHFQSVRQQMQRNWQAIHQNKPVNHLFSLLHHQLQYGSYTAAQLAESVEDLDFEHYCNLLPGMLRDAQVKLLIHGDIQAETALELAHWVENTLPVVSVQKSKALRSVKRLSSGIFETSFHNEHSDYAFALFIQGRNTSLSEKALFLILNHIFNPSFFNSLRTEQQLGYLVGSSYIPMHGLPGLLCYVQSPSHTAAQIREAIEAFIADFIVQLEFLSTEILNNAKAAVLNHLTDSAPSLRIRAQRYWSSIINNQGEFTLAAEVADQVQATTLEEFLDFCRSRLGSEIAAMALASSQVKS